MRMLSIGAALAVAMIAAEAAPARADDDIWTSRNVIIGLNYYPASFDAGKLANNYCGGTGHWRMTSYHFDKFTPTGPGNYGKAHYFFISCLVPPPGK